MLSCKIEPAIGTHIEFKKFSRKLRIVDEAEGHLIIEPVPQQVKSKPIK